jgi:hypothetical protein
MKRIALLVALIVLGAAYAELPAQQSMSNWAGKYPGAKFFNQQAIKTPLRRILTRSDYASIRDYNLIVPIKRLGDYLVTYGMVKYSDPVESMSVVYGIKDKAVYVLFSKGEEHRKYSTKNNQLNLPDEVLVELGLKEE